MPINFDLDARRAQGGKLVRDPRVVMRALIGVLLVANLAAAVIAFKPFGGSADDLTLQETALRTQLTALDNRVAMDRKLVAKVEGARKEGEAFLSTYFLDRRTQASSVADELLRITKEAGMKALPRSEQLEVLTGSDTLQMDTIT